MTVIFGLSIVEKKDDFVFVPRSKQGLIDLAIEELHKQGCTVVNATGDANADIVKAAIKASQNQQTTLLGKDTV